MTYQKQKKESFSTFTTDTKPKNNSPFGGIKEKTMTKSELKASKDSQGFYEVTYYGEIIWDGFAANAAEAKKLAIEYNS